MFVDMGENLKKNWIIKFEYSSHFQIDQTLSPLSSTFTKHLPAHNSFMLHLFIATIRIID